MSGNDSMSAGSKSTSNEQHDAFFGDVDVDLAVRSGLKPHRFYNATWKRKIDRLQ
jgi:hypothetical protein